MITTGNRSNKQGVTYFNPPDGIAAITSTPTSGLRTDHAGRVGCRFTVGASDITVRQLGRWVVSGNSLSHTVSIVNEADVIQVSGSVNTSGASSGYLYVPVTPTVLRTGVAYYLFSEETSGGDEWHQEETVTTVAAITITHSAYSTPGGVPTNGSLGVASYVPPNFKYT